MNMEITEEYIKYKRKSQDDDTKQVISLPSQDRAIGDAIPFTKTIKPLADFEESKSAKAPGREKFNQMCELIESKKAKVIVCWQLNRLARNAVDGGRIIWLVQNYGVKIITPHKSYDVSDILQMYVEFAMANNFIIDLQKSTARGMEDKLIAGHAPIYAPIGYLNDTTKKQGLRDILVDEARFPLIRKMWELLLNMHYTPTRILEIATNEWGLRNRKGKALSRTQVYTMFTNVFYIGQFVYEGKIYQGVHRPMVTPEEYDRAQVILGRKGKPRLAKHDFAFTNLIKCTCGSSITAHERYRKTCQKCFHRFNMVKYDDCPKCNEPAPDKFNYFCYFHCTKKADPLCKQPHVSLVNLEKEFDKHLATLTIPQEFVDWAMDKLRKEQLSEVTNRGVILDNLQATYAGITRRIDNLSLKYFSDGNKLGEIVSDTEYKRLKADYQKEQKELEEQVKGIRARQELWLETSELVLNFSKQATQWFDAGTKEQKRSIASAFGLNLLLDDGLLRLNMLKPFERIQEASAKMREDSRAIEPVDYADKSIQTYHFDPSNPYWGG